MKQVIALLLASMLTGCAGTMNGFVKDIKDSKEDIAPRSEYQKSVLKSSIIPGGGWIYECNDKRGPCEHAVSPGVAYFLATGASALFIAKGIKDHNTSMAVWGSLGFITLRFNDIRWSMNAAKRAEGK